MADGWETARRLDRPPQLKVRTHTHTQVGANAACCLQVDGRGILQLAGWEWAVFRLGHPGTVHTVEVDTRHFKGPAEPSGVTHVGRALTQVCFPPGNSPDSCWVEACSLSPAEEVRALRTGWTSGTWCLLLPPQKVGVGLGLASRGGFLIVLSRVAPPSSPSPVRGAAAEVERARHARASAHQPGRRSEPPPPVGTRQQQPGTAETGVQAVTWSIRFQMLESADLWQLWRHHV